MRRIKWHVLVVVAGVALVVAWRGAIFATGRDGKAETGGLRFDEVASKVGLQFVYENGADGSLFLPEIMGSGVALFDYDNDGDLDVYFTNAGGDLASGASSADTNLLFRRDATGAYQDVSAASGLDDDGYGMGVAVGDIDNDGDRDVFVTNLGADRLYINNGNGTFDDQSDRLGRAMKGWSCSASFLDYDRDGFLDLFVTQYVLWASDRKCFSASGRRDYCGPYAFPPVSDILLHNQGDGTFKDVSEEAGISTATAAGLGVACDDFNDDGLIDIYVANDAHANNLWINQGDGRFVDQAQLMGAAYNGSGLPEAGMGVVAADFDNDTDIDLYMTHLQRESNTMYRNDGKARGFVDATGEAGLAWSSVPFTGFGTVALDAEMDGDLDLLVVNGRVYLETVLPGALPPSPWDQLAEPNLLYVNEGAARFQLHERTAFDDPIEISRGLAMGDVDNDGDVDCVVSNLLGPARLYLNSAKPAGNWLTVRATHPNWKRDAIGARIIVRCGDRRLVRTVTRGSSYLSSHDPRAHFGLGDAITIDEVAVVWPDGKRELFDGPPVNGFVQLVRGQGR